MWGSSRTRFAQDEIRNRHIGANPIVSNPLLVLERVLTAHPYSSVEERLPSKQ
jgi:hypothetical protein